MTECDHFFDPVSQSTCTICHGNDHAQAISSLFNPPAIKLAIAELGKNGPFRTKQVAEHARVVEAHAQMTADPEFAQHVGTYLSKARGQLGIERIEPFDQSNARWQLLNPPSPDDGK